jgi:hypothetical protein
MATKKTTTARPTKSPTKTKLPLALAKRVASEVEAKKGRVAQAARDDVALIGRLRARIGEDFYEMGLALQRLKQPAAFGALGYPSFSALCAAELDMSVTKAEVLVGLAARVPRALAARTGQDRATALMALADATPEEDTPADLERAHLRLPDGKALDVAKASTLAIFAAARAIRAAHPKAGKPRGRTTTPEERALGASLEQHLRAAGAKQVRVEVLATKPGAGADVRIRLSLAELGHLRAALGTLPPARAPRATPTRKKPKLGR